LSLVRAVKRGIFSRVAAVERLMHKGDAGHGVALCEVRNFLLLQHSAALGTAIHATPLIPALREAVPGCGIAVAASGFSLDLLRHNPGVDWLIETPSPLHDLKGAVRMLRQRNPFFGTTYATLTSVGNERTRVAAQAVLSGAALRVGFTLVPQMYRVALDFDPALSQIANNLRIIGALGHSVRHFEPQMFYSDSELAGARETLANGGLQQGQPVAVFVTQTSVTQRKSWRSERFRAAAEFLTRQYGAHILFVGTAAESAAIDALRGGLSFATTSVAGKTSLAQLAALMSLCSVGLTLDTGPLHVGRAVGLPMVIIAPAWSPPIEWLPLGNDRFRILKNADMTSAPADYIIDEVSVDEVTSALADLLTRYPRQTFQQTGV
jgi:ADP-heptose:LPS heptosyltransferase